MLKSKNILSTTAFAVVVHTSVWLLVLHLGFNLFGLLESFSLVFFEGEGYIDEAFLIIVTLVLLFYLNSHFLVPKYLNEKSWWKYLLLLIGSTLLSLYSGFFLFIYFIVIGYESGVENADDFFDLSLSIHLIIVGISTSLGINKIAIKNARLKNQAIAKQKESELKYLNNQFNPHFLFNTLNGIYALSTEEEALKTTEAILKLSEIMRYPISEGTKKEIALIQEIEFITDYIELQKLRLGDSYPIRFNFTGNYDYIKIAPLLFIPIIENAFKYGISQKKQSPISFSLSIHNNNLIFLSENEINNTNVDSHHTGIENLTQRLNLLYGKKHLLTIENKDNNFYVKLEIPVLD